MLHGLIPHECEQQMLGSVRKAIEGSIGLFEGTVIGQAKEIRAEQSCQFAGGTAILGAALKVLA